jgi:hypothetical protein
MVEALMGNRKLEVLEIIKISKIVIEECKRHVSKALPARRRSLPQGLTPRYWEGREGITG